MNRQKLKIIVEVLSLFFEVDASEIKGVKDTPEKIIACYMATRITRLSDWHISRFFQINPVYMKKRIIDLSVELLVDEQVKADLLMVEKSIENIAKIKVES